MCNNACGGLAVPGCNSTVPCVCLAGFSGRDDWYNMPGQCQVVTELQHGIHIFMLLIVASNFALCVLLLAQSKGYLARLRCMQSTRNKVNPDPASAAPAAPAPAPVFAMPGSEGRKGTMPKLGGDVAKLGGSRADNKVLGGSIRRRVSSAKDDAAGALDAGSSVRRASINSVKRDSLRVPDREEILSALEVKKSMRDVLEMRGVGMKSSRSSTGQAGGKPLKHALSRSNVKGIAKKTSVRAMVSAPSHHSLKSVSIPPEASRHLQSIATRASAHTALDMDMKGFVDAEVADEDEGHVGDLPRRGSRGPASSFVMEETVLEKTKTGDVAPDEPADSSSEAGYTTMPEFFNNVVPPDATRLSITSFTAVGVKKMSLPELERRGQALVRKATEKVLVDEVKSNAGRQLLLDLRNSSSLMTSAPGQAGTTAEARVSIRRGSMPVIESEIPEHWLEDEDEVMALEEDTFGDLAINSSSAEPLGTVDELRDSVLARPSMLSRAPSAKGLNRSSRVLVGKPPSGIGRMSARQNSAVRRNRSASLAEAPKLLVDTVEISVSRLFMTEFLNPLGLAQELVHSDSGSDEDDEEEESSEVGEESIVIPARKKNIMERAAKPIDPIKVMRRLSIATPIESPANSAGRTGSGDDGSGSPGRTGSRKRTLTKVNAAIMSIKMKSSQTLSRSKSCLAKVMSSARKELRGLSGFQALIICYTLSSFGATIMYSLQVANIALQSDAQFTHRFFSYMALCFMTCGSWMTILFWYKALPRRVLGMLKNFRIGRFATIICASSCFVLLLALMLPVAWLDSEFFLNNVILVILALQNFVAFMTFRMVCKKVIMELDAIAAVLPQKTKDILRVRRVAAVLMYSQAVAFAIAEPTHILSIFWVWARTRQYIFFNLLMLVAYVTHFQIMFIMKNMIVEDSSKLKRTNKKRNVKVKT